MADVKSIEHPLGRRSWDRGNKVAWWVLVIGALFQGGNYLVVREQLNMAERQQNAERNLRDKQHEDMMMLYETVSEQMDSVLNVIQIQAGEGARERPKTLKIRRAAKAVERKLKMDPPKDIGGVK